MADFCKQCSILMFGEDFGDFDNLPGMREGDQAAVICEGCGFTEIDHHGKCLRHTDAEHEDAILKGIMPKGDASTR